MSGTFTDGHKDVIGRDVLEFVPPPDMCHTTTASLMQTVTVQAKMSRTHKLVTLSIRLLPYNQCRKTYP